MPIGSLAHVGLGKETTFGTPVAATDYIRFASESLNETIEQVKSDGIMAVFDEMPQLEGAHTVDGDISFDVYPNIVGHLLRSAFGAPTTTAVAGSTGAYTHVFTPIQTNFAANCALPPYTFEVNRDIGQAFQYTGAVVNELTLNFGSDKKIMQGQASVIAKALALITKTTPTFDAQDPFTWNQAVITLNGTTNTNVSTIEFGIKNELEAKDVLDGTRFVGRIVRNGRRSFPIKYTLELADQTEYALFRAQNEVALKIELTGGIAAGTANYKLTIDVPKFHFNTFPINVGGSGSLTAAVDGVAEYSPVDTYAMKVTLVNTKASY
jgi:hypothetical protein